MASDVAGLAPQDLELLDRIAARIVELRAEAAAILVLEGGRPLSLIAGQTLHFFEPIVGALLRLPDYRRFAALIERRETIDALLNAIERRANLAQAARRAARHSAATPPAASDKPGERS